MNFLLAFSISEYLNFYVTFVKTQWRSMTPTGYLTLLILVAVAGWMMMKSDYRKNG